jgi:hypothetical protein
LLEAAPAYTKAGFELTLAYDFSKIVTVREILSHRSCIPNVRRDQNSQGNVNTTPITKDEMLALIAKATPGARRREEAAEGHSFKGFITGIRRDYAAVQKAFTSPWSNGQTAGQVNKLRYIKRQMFGRAKFDLLKARVLNAI